MADSITKENPGIYKELKALREDVKDLKALMHGTPVQKVETPPENQPQSVGEPYFDLESGKFPWMTIKSPIFVNLAFPDIADLEELIRHKSLSPDEVNFEISESSFFVGTDEAFSRYFQHVHIWYPLFDHSTYLQLLNLLVDERTLPEHDSMYCCAVLIYCLANILSPESDGLSDVPLSQAYKCLPRVLTEESMSSVQALILFGIYFLSTMRPYESMTYMQMSFTKFLSVAVRYKVKHYELPPTLVRVFWVIYVMTMELAAYLVSEEVKRLVHEADSMELPLSFESLFGAGYPVCTLQSCPICLHREKWRISDAYLLSEITMRRFLQRSTFLGLFSITSEYDVSPSRLGFAPVVVKELLQQLDEWRQCLPEDLLRSPSDKSSSSREFLELQYFACLVTINWPAAYSILTGVLTDTELQFDNSVNDAAKNFFATFESFTDGFNIMLENWLDQQQNGVYYVPYIWTIGITQFVFLAAAKAASTSTSLGTDTARITDVSRKGIYNLRRLVVKCPMLGYCYQLAQEKLS
ncbi:hypothetical protein TRICI_005050 [Trichomonascus ciferrii]|uniref:Transcription factor domain-containing protein n=1 Tax=Trichomonascus ciferrii TaxID=44093 RepID=A0A642UY98_9ASCO|nr:hypothetical protein TRICI_005050 [Trichomonascus ciferrii]